MARIVNFELKTIERPSRHGIARATYSVVDIDGDACLQIDTYGSGHRQMPGKVSQSVQFGPEALAELRRILDEFP